ncbi:MAG: GDP-mannose 4,6-dehydratase, partial [Candidatus Omnitrophica bacterium]|nr:GDP-mannose 4,6-dehydratase [Candidatus Omnitrophota bacterium]
MNLKFWQNKNVLITGYEGFLGSHLTKTLLNLKANVWGLDILVRRRKTILSKNDFKKINIIKGNVEKFPLILKTIQKNKIEVIFHLAAKSLVEESLRQPIKTFSTNIKGTWNILEATRLTPYIKSIIIASSDKAYGEQKKFPIKEDQSLKGSYPYDVSKSCTDLIAQSYAKTYNLPVVIARCGNIYGPGDFNFSRIIPDTIRSALFNRPLFIRSNGKFIRDYVYIDDIIKGYLLLGENIQKLNLKGEAFNFGNEEPISVIGVVRKIYNFLNKKPNYVILNRADFEIRKQYLDSKKVRRILG